MEKTEKLSGLRPFVKRNAWVCAIAAVVLFVVPLAVPMSFAGPWALGYAFGTPVSLESAGSCDVETSVRGSSSSSFASCEGAIWRANGRDVTGTLRADGTRLVEDSSGPLLLDGPVRAIGGTAYGDPGLIRIAASVSLLFALALGLLAVGGGLVAAAVLAGRRVVSDDTAMDLGITEAGLVGIAFGVTMTVFAGAVSVAMLIGIVVAAGSATCAVIGLRRLFEQGSRAGAG